MDTLTTSSPQISNPEETKASSTQYGSLPECFACWDVAEQCEWLHEEVMPA